MYPLCIAGYFEQIMTPNHKDLFHGQREIEDEQVPLHGDSVVEQHLHILHLPPPVGRDKRMQMIINTTHLHE